MSDKPDKTQNFIQFLWKLERKGFAELRRSLSDSANSKIRAISYVEPFAASETNLWHSTMYYLVAALFCLVERPLEKDNKIPVPLKQNLGESIAQLYLAKEKSGSIEQRFIRLLDADEEQLSDRLRQMVTLLRSNSISIGWENLLNDLCYWHNEKRSVQHYWAKSFYLKSESNPQEPETTGGTHESTFRNSLAAKLRTKQP